MKPAKGLGIAQMIKNLNKQNQENGPNYFNFEKISNEQYLK